MDDYTHMSCADVPISEGGCAGEKNHKGRHICVVCASYWPCTTEKKARKARAAETAEADENRLDHLTSLKQGWYDGEQGQPIAAQALKTAGQAIGPLRDLGYGQPLMYPTLDGGIQIEWVHGGLIREVEIGAGEEIKVCEYDQTTGQERENTVNTIDQMCAFFKNQPGRKPDTAH